MAGIWEDEFRGYVKEISFSEAPLWLKLLSRTFLLERFAYPIALRKGLGTLWPLEGTKTIDLNLNAGKWKIENYPKSDESKFKEGSLAYFSANPAKRKVFRYPAITREGRRIANEKYIHKINGTYSKYKSLRK